MIQIKQFLTCKNSGQSLSEARIDGWCMVLGGGCWLGLESGYLHSVLFMQDCLEGEAFHLLSQLEGFYNYVLLYSCTPNTYTTVLNLCTSTLCTLNPQNLEAGLNQDRKVYQFPQSDFQERLNVTSCPTIMTQCVLYRVQNLQDSSIS